MNFPKYFIQARAARVLSTTLVVMMLGICLGWSDDKADEKKDMENRLERMEALIVELRDNQARLNQLAEKILGGSDQAPEPARGVVRKRRVPMLPLPPAQEVTGEFGGHRYRLVPSAKSWNEAEAFARQEGGYLVVIGSQQEQDYIESLLKGACNGSLPATWIGLKKTEGGEWRWVEGENSSFFYWREGEPNNATSGTENRAHLGLFGEGKWNDKEETKRMYSIIEFSDSKP